MNGAFYIAATGLQAQQSALDVVANNIANVNTPGFKRAQVRFSELISPPDPLSPPSAQAVQAFSGVSSTASAPVFTPGVMQQTGNPSDIAINGAGFIELMGPGGQTLLWRGGALKINADGYLAASNDMPLKAMILAPAGATSVTIDASGQVMAAAQNGAQPQVIGQLELVMPKDLSQLTDTGGGLYKPDAGAAMTTERPGDNGAGSIAQGSLEGSNVQLSDEMVQLLILQRAYAANAQIVQAGDQLMGIANQLRR